MFPHPLSLAAIITAYYAHYTLKDVAGIRTIVFILVIVMISMYCYTCVEFCALNYLKMTIV